MMSKRVILDGLVGLLFLTGTGGIPAENLATRQIFEEKYLAYLKFLGSSKAMALSDSSGTSTQEYREIVGLGVRILPYLMEKFEDDGKLFGVVMAVSGRQYTEKEKQAFGGDLRALYLRWWKVERHRTGEEFWRKYCRWKRSQKEHERKPEAKLWPYAKASVLCNMGVIVVPWLVMGIEQGDLDLIYILNVIVRRVSGGPAVPEDATPEQCIEWWKKNKDDWWWVSEESVKWPPVYIYQTTCEDVCSVHSEREKTTKQEVKVIHEITTLRTYRSPK